MARISSVKRTTSETTIEASVAIDGDGRFDIATGVGLDRKSVV